VRIAVYYDLAAGGAAFALGRFVEFLRSRHRVDVFAARGAVPIVSDTRFIGPAPRVFRAALYYANRLSEPARHLRLGRAEARLAETLAPYDRVLVHSCRGRGAPALLSRLPGTRFYVTEPLRLYREPRPAEAAAPALWRAARLAYAPVSTALNRADRRHARAATALFANSTFTREEVRRVYGREARVAYPSVDPAWLGGDAGEGGGGYVLSPGALHPQKGHGRVLRALARLSNPPPLVAAGFAGRPGTRRRLAGLARDLGVTLRLVADPARETLMDLVRRAEVVALAPVREPFGLVSVEAQALGRPVVAVNEGGLPETLLPGETGLLAPADPERFAATLAALLEDPARARRLGRAGRESVVERFSPEARGERLAALLEDNAPGGHAGTPQ